MSESAPQINRGWFKATRGDEPLEIIRTNPSAFILAYIIAARAWWREGFNQHGLEQGEAMLGDYQNLGMTEQQYRTAKAQLQRWNFATFKTTNKGTIGKLIDTRLFSIFADDANDQNNGRVTDDQRTTNGRVTTNKELKNDKSDKKERKDTGSLSECEAIYQAYPNKVGKPAALKAIAKALTKRSADELLTLTQAYAKARGSDLSFVPHPATWFNQERFNDDAATWTRQAAPIVSKRNIGTAHEHANFKAYDADMPVSKRNKGTTSERADHAAYDRVTLPAAAVGQPEARAVTPDASEGFMEFLTAPAPQPVPPVVAVTEAHPVAPEVPTREAAIAFAATMSKRTDAAQVVEKWLGEFTADPKADWRMSVLRRLLKKAR